MSPLVTIYGDPPLPVTGAGGLGTPFSSSIGDECRQGNSPFNTLTTAWGVARLTIYVPFYVQAPCTAYKMGWENGATVAGNVDVGILETDGTRLVNSGSTAMAGVSVRQRVDITDTPLTRGTYLAAFSSDSTTATFNGSPLIVRAGRMLGVQEQTPGVFGIPASASFSVYASIVLIPLIIVETRNVA